MYFGPLTKKLLTAFLPTVYHVFQNYRVSKSKERCKVLSLLERGDFFSIPTLRLRHIFPKNFWSQKSKICQKFSADSLAS